MKNITMEEAYEKFIYGLKLSEKERWQAAAFISLHFRMTFGQALNLVYWR